MVTQNINQARKGPKYGGLGPVLAVNATAAHAAARSGSWPNKGAVAELRKAIVEDAPGGE